MPRLFIVGLSGQLGDALRPMLPAAGIEAMAMSRFAQPPSPGIDWRRDKLQTLQGLPPGFDAVLSLGPLDAFSEWACRAKPEARIVAIGSTGVRDKQASADPRERDEARRLAQAEAALFDFGGRQGVAVTVLRPTLLYGNGRDRSLSRLAALARRWRRLPWPDNATGLRQPVHVEDVARAVLDCLDRSETAGRAFDLPGGETLGFDAMVERYLAVHAPGAHLWCVPGGAIRSLAAVAGLVGTGEGLRGWLARAASDQVADPAPAQMAFGYRPRAFSP